MKKLVLSLSALFAFGLASAQETSTSGEGFTKGDTFISGGIGFSSQKSGENDKSNQFNISPRAAYFITSNIALGVRLNYSHRKIDSFFDTGAAIQKDNSLSAGVFGRYYVTPANKFSFFAQLGADYISTKSTLRGYNYNMDYKTKGVGITLSPAISYFISDHFALEALFGVLSYNSYKPNNDAAIREPSTNSFNANLDLSNINLGLVYKF